MLYSVDRIEGNYALCEDENGNIKEIEIKKLPKGLKEGTIISYNKEEKKFKIEKEETSRRRQEAFDLQNKLFNKE